jgi:hypothetical protein
MNKLTKLEEKPATTFKISLQIYSGGSSMIFDRKDGLPFIIDKTDNAVRWLIANGYKEKDIKIIGEKPAIWDELFSPPILPVEPTLVEQVTEILSSEPVEQVTEILSSEPVEQVTEILSSEPV